MQQHIQLDLRLFDGEGAVADSGAPATPASKTERNPLANVRYGKQGEAQKEGPAQPAREASPKEPDVAVTTDAQEARRAEFERLIKGDYKDLYDKRVQDTINARFKQVKALEEKAGRADALAPVLDLLAGKYGVDASDAEALAKAIEADDSYYEQEAMEKGLSVEQLKAFKRMERENAAFKRMVQEQEQRQAGARMQAELQRQSENCQRIYPGFDLRAELERPGTGERFFSLLKSGVDVQTAYEVVHKDELVAGAMEYTAKAVQQKTVNDIRARGLRPAENGVSGGGSAITVKTDPRTFTRKDREEIARRVLRGERIQL